jgi:predicted nucleic acid-binding protein
LRYVLDACAMLAYLAGEPGADAIDALLRDGEAECSAHAINLCEVYYDLFRSRGELVARAAVNDLTALGILERSDMDPVLWRAAGHIKARGRISLADAFCAALANRLDAEVVTSDRREFTPLMDEGVCRVRFFR